MARLDYLLLGADVAGIFDLLEEFLESFGLNGDRRRLQVGARSGRDDGCVTGEQQLMGHVVCHARLLAAQPSRVVQVLRG